MTKAQAFTMIRKMVAENEDLVAFVDNELALLEKRKGAATKAKQAKAEEDAKLAEKIVEVVSDSTEALTTKEIANAVGISPQKATPIIHTLVEDEKRLTFKVVKGKKFFGLAA